MSRRLNIERRRKRIRHYTARRRRRSPVHRAVLYWWGTVLLLTVTGVVLALLLLLRNLGRPGCGPETKWRLPAASLRLIAVPEQAVAEALRMGNVRRSARAMSDADIGISFAMPLPEPAPLQLRSLPPLPSELPVRVPERPGMNLPPLFSGAVAGGVPVALRPEPALTAAGYLPSRPPQPESGTCGSALFSVHLDETGRAVHVFRLAPAGEETPWLRSVRLMLLRTRGTAAASGRITVVWNTKDLP